MKRYYFACKTLFLIFSFFVIGSGNVESKLLRNQDRPTVIKQKDVVYQQQEVDVKAVIDRRTIKHPSGRSCKDSDVKVVLRAVLHKSGKVTDVEILESSSCKSFQNAAIETTHNLSFTPARKNGVAVSQYQTLIYDRTDR
jgi:TonB family protein